MTQATGSLDRRKSSLRSGPAAQVVATPDDKKQRNDTGRTIEFINAIDHARGN